jgi:hypothetical protein
VLFSFSLPSEFQRAIDPALKTYKQPVTLRFEVFTCGAILGINFVRHLQRDKITARFGTHNEQFAEPSR